MFGALQQGFAQDAPHVGAGLVESTTADAYFVYDAGCLVEQKYPEDLYCEVA